MHRNAVDKLPTTIIIMQYLHAHDCSDTLLDVSHISSGIANYLVWIFLIHV